MEEPKRAAPELNIVFQDTPEKFRHTADEILPSFLKQLWDRNRLEEEVHDRWEKLENGRLETGIAPGGEELWQEYRRRYLGLVQPWCAPGF